MLTRYFVSGLLLAALVAFLVNPYAGGVVASLVFGFMAGNFACSLVHRLPRNKSMLDHAPYCGSCHHPLSEADLLPVIGAVLLKHRCRYCGVPFPHSHTWTELACGALFALSFVRLSFSQDYVLVVLLGTFLVTLAAIEINDRKIQIQVLFSAMVLGMLYRTLHDAEIYNFLQGSLYGLMIGALVWHRKIKRVAHIYTVPDGMKMTALAGICAGGMDVWPVLALAAVLHAVLWLTARIMKRAAPPVSIAIGLGIMALMLWPDAMAILPRYPQ